MIMGLLASAVASSPARICTSSSPSWNGEWEGMVLASLRVTLFDYPALKKLQEQAVALLYLVCAEGAKAFRDARPPFQPRRAWGRRAMGWLDCAARLCGSGRCANIERNTRNHGNQSGETRHAHETG